MTALASGSYEVDLASQQTCASLVRLRRPPAKAFLAPGRGGSLQVSHDGRPDVAWLTADDRRTCRSSAWCPSPG